VAIRPAEVRPAGRTNYRCDRRRHGTPVVHDRPTRATQSPCPLGGRRRTFGPGGAFSQLSLFSHRPLVCVLGARFLYTHASETVFRPYRSPDEWLFSLPRVATTPLRSCTSPPPHLCPPQQT